VKTLLAIRPQGVATLVGSSGTVGSILMVYYEPRSEFLTIGLQYVFASEMEISVPES